MRAAPTPRHLLLYLWALLGLVCGGVPRAGAAEEAHWKSASYLVEAFVDIALGNEYPPKRGLVRKWTSPIRYHLIHRTGDESLHEKLIRTHLAHLAEITGADIRHAESPSSANYLVVLTTEDKLKEDLLTYFGWRSARQREKFFRETVCLAIFSTRPQGHIVKAVAIIPVDRARARGKLLSCVVEELTQVMGLPNDSDKVFPSVFNDHSTDQFLSGLDLLLLKTLYDPRIRPGTNEAAVRPVLQEIAAEIVRSKGFDAAEKAAATGGLSALSP